MILMKITFISGSVHLLQSLHWTLTEERTSKQNLLSNKMFGNRIGFQIKA